MSGDSRNDSIQVDIPFEDDPSTKDRPTEGEGSKENPFEEESLEDEPLKEVNYTRSTLKTLP